MLAIALLDDDDATVSTWPTSYTDSQVPNNTGQASTTLGASVAISSRLNVSAGSEDPSATIFSSSDGFFAYSVALRPFIPATGGGGPNEFFTMAGA